jgi:hypothetical protein
MLFTMWLCNWVTVFGKYSNPAGGMQSNKQLLPTSHTLQKHFCFSLYNFVVALLWDIIVHLSNLNLNDRPTPIGILRSASHSEDVASTHYGSNQLNCLVKCENLYGYYRNYLMACNGCNYLLTGRYVYMIWTCKCHVPLFFNISYICPNL